MVVSPLATKIRALHRERPALIYVRQSTLAQVRSHTASAQRQYDLVQRALDLGWTRAQIQVIDEDQGHSGATAQNRPGFQSLIAQVGLGRAGAVLSLEASRLARACSDWYRLLELCALAQTLVIDEEGVYDPSDYNDRLLLGFKGAMSEAELHVMRQRLLGGLREKAAHGELRLPLPTGLVYDPTGRVVLDPDEQVQSAVRLVFALFEQHGTARSVVAHCVRHQLRLPTRSTRRADAGALRWVPPASARVLVMLHNPAYAGAYVYGRFPLRPGETPTSPRRPRRVAMEAWSVCLREVHPGYISWEQFCRNQERLADNRTFRPEEARGAPREGAALLQGIVRCGRCGRPMYVRYREGHHVPSYECLLLHMQYAGPRCQGVRGDVVDEAVAQALLEAMQPAQLEISLATLEQIEERARQIDRQWERQIERAQYEADLARRRLVAVEPENRLVARTLEREWEEQLAQLERLRSEAERRPPLAAPLTTPEERAQILALAQDLPAVWQAATTRPVERKQLLRFLMKEVTLTRGERTIRVGIRWQTGACTTLEVPRPPHGYERDRTDPAVVERIRELAPDHTDREIAAVLNQEGHTTGTGKLFTGMKAHYVRVSRGIAAQCPEMGHRCGDQPRGDGRYSAPAVARLLGVDLTTIHGWCRSGRVEGVQATAGGCWWVRLTPEQIAAAERRQGQGAERAGEEQ